MQTLEAIEKRVSVRKFKSEQISEENLQKILKAGMSAPVGSGAYDSLHITVCQNMDILNQVGDMVSDMVEKMLGKRMDKNFGAPTCIFVSAKPGMMPGIEMANAACVLENMLIAATDLGIDNIIWGGGAVVIQDDEMKEKFGIPESFKPVLCASFGYAETEEPVKKHTISYNRI